MADTICTHANDDEYLSIQKYSDILKTKCIDAFRRGMYVSGNVCIVLLQRLEQSFKSQ